jgi:hypothetical protein
VVEAVVGLWLVVVLKGSKRSFEMEDIREIG